MAGVGAKEVHSCQAGPGCKANRRNKRGPDRGNWPIQAAILLFSRETLRTVGLSVCIWIQGMRAF